jgi:hypothetical protein
MNNLKFKYMALIKLQIATLILIASFISNGYGQECPYYDNYNGPTIGGPYLESNCFAPIDR